MSMTLDLRVNGERVGIIEAVRTSPVSTPISAPPTDDVMCTYDVQRFVFGQTVEKAHVRHRYGDGAWVLAGLAVDALADAEQRQTERAQLSGKFEVFEDVHGKWRFRLKAPDGQIVASGQGYLSKANARKGIDSVRRALDGAIVYDAETGEPM